MVSSTENKEKVCFKPQNDHFMHYLIEKEKKK